MRRGRPEKPANLCRVPSVSAVYLVLVLLTGAGLNRSHNGAPVAVRDQPDR
jgi:hypothetical protein